MMLVIYVLMIVYGYMCVEKKNDFKNGEKNFINVYYC